MTDTKMTDTKISTVKVLKNYVIASWNIGGLTSTKFQKVIELYDPNY